MSPNLGILSGSWNPLRRQRGTLECLLLQGLVVWRILFYRTLNVPPFQSSRDPMFDDQLLSSFLECWFDLFLAFILGIFDDSYILILLWKSDSLFFYDEACQWQANVSRKRVPSCEIVCSRCQEHLEMIHEGEGYERPCDTNGGRWKWVGDVDKPSTTSQELYTRVTSKRDRHITSSNKNQSQENVFWG